MSEEPSFLDEEGHHQDSEAMDAEDGRRAQRHDHAGSEGAGSLAPSAEPSAAVAVQRSAVSGQAASEARHDPTAAAVGGVESMAEPCQTVVPSERHPNGAAAGADAINSGLSNVASGPVPAPQPSSIASFPSFALDGPAEHHRQDDFTFCRVSAAQQRPYAPPSGDYYTAEGQPGSTINWRGAEVSEEPGGAGNSLQPTGRFGQMAGPGTGASPAPNNAAASAPSQLPQDAWIQNFRAFTDAAGTSERPAADSALRAVAAAVAELNRVENTSFPAEDDVLPQPSSAADWPAPSSTQAAQPNFLDNTAAAGTSVQPARTSSKEPSPQAAATEPAEAAAAKPSSLSPSYPGNHGGGPHSEDPSPTAAAAAADSKAGPSAAAGGDKRAAYRGMSEEVRPERNGPTWPQAPPGTPCAICHRQEDTAARHRTVSSWLCDFHKDAMHCIALPIATARSVVSC